MPHYYKIQCSEKAKVPFEGIQAYQTDFKTRSDEQYTKFDFSKYVLIELLDCVTHEEKLWEELGLTNKTSIIHKRLMIDAHRVHCRRAIVICLDSEEAKNLAQRLSQTKIFKRCVCTVVVQELLSDINLFEKQLIHFGDRRSQEQLVYVTDLNRYREPESLVQYLLELFSPFGRILFILVAKDKNGYAYPEGIVLFSHLSEAFAAELAYDQCVIGMERLSVTVHHNILLSQCDLRTRLKEAQIKSESISFDERDYIEDKFLFPISPFIVKSNVVSRVGSVMCKTSYANIHHKSDVCFINSSVDTYKNSCQDNETPYLEHMAICSNNSLHINLANKKTCIDNDSNNIKHIQKSENPFVHDTNITNTRLKKAIYNDEQSKLHSTLFSDLSLSKKFHNCKKMLNDQEQSIEILSRTSGNSDVTLPFNDFDTNYLSQSKKNSLLSEKLCLKRQRLHSTHSPFRISSSEPSISTFKTQSCAIKCISEKYKSEDPHKEKSQILKSFYDTCESFNNTTLAFDRCIDKENLSDVKIRNSPTNSVNSVMPLPTDRNSETTFYQQNLAHRERKSQLKKECPLQSVAAIPRYEKNVSSPLKTWLKEELSYSINNRVADCMENSRKIVCVTPKRDVLVPVGCSHMTCDFCYPRSTNLLFGFY